MPAKIQYWLVVFIFLSACQFTPYPEDVFDAAEEDSDTTTQVASVGGTPSPGSQDIYATADLSNLCVDQELCSPSYDPLPSWFIRTDGQEPLSTNVCNYDYDPNLVSTFSLYHPGGSLNGLKLLLSKEDLFFIAWNAVRQKINPHFLLGVLSQESAGNCSAVSSAGGEGCFQITNTFGQAQLGDSYRNRVSSWFWGDRTDFYYPDDLFVDELSYFGEEPDSEQFRITLDPFQETIESIVVSSVVNFHFGAIASSLYFNWQHYLLYYNFPELRDAGSEIFESEDGKALWQAAAYNGGAYGAASALEEKGEDFLDEMRDETQDYAEAVVDYCKGYQEGEESFTATYTEEDLEWIIDLLAGTYPSDIVNWDEVKSDVSQVFFTEASALTFVDDIKAIIYVISTHLPALAPEWPDDGSI
ncbi:MAG: hypothetical protein Q7T11_09360 [Deltaproteobacteria bacterium]|nr:hypothetical protein [Deltaproteobacteria bacterium]